ncbi:MAG TPA: transporter, partial [Acidobacteriaceae bacterium]
MTSMTTVAFLPASAPVAAQVVLGLVAALTWGGADFAGGLAARLTQPSRVIFVAHGASLLVLGLVMLLRGVGPMPVEGVALGLLAGVTGGVALMLFYQALALGGMGLSASVAGLLTAVLPVLLAVTREGAPGWFQVAGFLVAAAAIVLIAWSPGERSRPRTMVLATLAGAGFGVQLVVLHSASARCSLLGALALSRLGGATAGAAVMAWDGWRGGMGRRGVTSTERRRLAAVGSCTLLAIAAGLLDTAGNGFYMGAAFLGRLDIAAVLSSLYPGTTILLAAWLLKERTSRMQTIGMGLALVAV